MERLGINICCAALNFRNLEKNSLSILKSAHIPHPDKFITDMHLKLGFPVEQIAVIEKCNAVILLATYSGNFCTQLIHNRILDEWNRASEDGITDSSKYIQIFDDVKAIKYLGECVVGLHSVVTGDSQVYGQVRSMLIKATQLQKVSPAFNVILQWLKEVSTEVRNKTELHSGNASLERLACERITKVVDKKDSVAVIGLGRSGQLVAKILRLEKEIKTLVLNRTESVAQEIAKKYNANMVPFEAIETLQKTKAIFLALNCNLETLQYAANLVEVIKKQGSLCKLVIDLSSPPLLKKELLTGSNIEFLNIENFSRDKEKTLAIRETEINKAKQIIENSLPQVIEELNNTLSKNKIELQKRKGIIKINSKTLEVVKARDVLMTAIRDVLRNLKYVEIHTPCIVGVSTDPPKVDKGRAFGVSWPGSGAYLRQSNQIYKQLVVISGQPKIFEIGPFWREEAQETVRHLEETIGIDVEVRNPKNLKYLYRLAYSIISKSKDKLSKARIITQKLQLPKEEKVPVLEYCEAIELLNRSGLKISFGEDLGILGEARLGEIIKRNNASDVVIIQHYPDTVKKFYTWSKEDGLTETFDIILDGWEIASGALRETRVDEIERKMKLSGINPEQYYFYLSLIRGAPPHGGFGMGFDRLVAKLLGFSDIRDAVIFPRTLERLVP